MKESPFFVTSYTYDCTSYLIATFIQNLVLILDEFNLVLEYPASTSTSTTTTNPLRKQLVCSSLPPSTLLTGGNLLDNQTNCELTTSSNEVFNWPSSNDIFGNPDYSLSSLSSLIYNMSTNATNSSDLQLDTKGDYILLTYVQLTLVIAFILFGSIGNLLVCLAIGLDKKLHNVTNMFLFSLAIADLLVSLFVMPMGAIPAFWGSWPLGHIMCNVYTTCDVLACSASILHMLFISIGRYLGIKNPIEYRQGSSKRIVAIKIAIV
uniref:G-protein coupled receptors family 1 profile domain-containing protein n=1 Tax=Megaselia scalaris TaxID=36166 RepID=T1GQT8_MEGSC